MICLSMTNRSYLSVNNEIHNSAVQTVKVTESKALAICPWNIHDDLMAF